MSSIYQIEHLITIFDGLFEVSENTILFKGEHEPVYLPASAQGERHRVVFAHGFFASALHEIAHWCIAGAERRLLVDYGYWYCPDGRSAQQQAEFERVEIKPQALEWAFCLACGMRFNLSVDNLSGGGAADLARFKTDVWLQLNAYVASAFPARAQQFIDALRTFYQQAPLAVQLASSGDAIFAATR